MNANRQITRALTICLLPILLLASGCQHPATSKITGRWDLLVAEQIDSNSEQQNDDSTQQVLDNTENLFNSIANGETTGTMSLVFHGNGKLETFTDFPMASTGKPKVGTWSIQDWQPDQSLLVIECVLQDETISTNIQFIDDNTIELIPPNIAVLEKEFRFQRGE